MYGPRNSELSTCLFQFSHETRQTMLLYAYFTTKVDFKRKFNHYQSFLYEWRLTARTIRKFWIGPSIRIEYRIGRTIRNRITKLRRSLLESVSRPRRRFIPAADDSDSDAESSDDSDATTVDVHSALSEGEWQSDGEFSLPSHQRCACHTINLKATTDANKAQNDPQYKKVCRSTLARCNALWNKYQRWLLRLWTTPTVLGWSGRMPQDGILCTWQQNALFVWSTSKMTSFAKCAANSTWPGLRLATFITRILVNYFYFYFSKKMPFTCTFA